VVEPTVAALVLSLLHVPPGVASDNVMYEPMHAVVLPAIGCIALTNTNAVALHPLLVPVADVNVIVTDPPVTPVNNPVLEFMVAILLLLLLHAPLPVESLNVIEDPIHKDIAPLIAPGNVLTVTTVVAVQPDNILYVIIAVPVVTPVTCPELITVATEGLLLV
jgi:hypothetical protein